MGFKWILGFVLLEFSLQSAHAAFNAQVFATTSKVIIFQWDKVADASSYEITLALKSNPSAVVAFAVFGANIVMGSVSTGLTPNTNYSFTIEAKTSAGNVVNTDSGEHLTAPEQIDSVITVTAKDSTTLEMEFTPKAGVSKYIIRALDTQDPPTFIEEVEVTSSPALVPNLQPYTDYKLSIMSANDGGRSQPTAPVTAKTLLPPPQIQSSSPSNSTIDVSWTAVASAQEYTVFLLKYGASESEKMSHNTSNTNYAFTGLDPGALYMIECYAWDAEGRKGESAQTNQTTRPPAPPLSP
ncbi:hypothetical protein WMY93_018353 [Mugilogobius chulae]|uniref:Fibronectin type-III domain-containing protein n=1 Tax=Mugilogobius chulae TaxID=88201 RepID=A0AAW0NVV2_9GOBI